MTDPQARAQELGWDDIATGRTLFFPFRVSQPDMDAFRAFSGDNNPLHWDTEFCRAKGFDAPVVYGGVLVSQISRVIGMEMPGRDAVWGSLDIRFRGPLMVDEEAMLEVKVVRKSTATKLIELAITITAGANKVATAKTTAFLRTS